MNPLTREWMFWLAAIACAAAEGAIIVSSVRSLRRSDGVKAAREAMWAVIPAIALAWLLAATWSEVKRGSAHDQMNMPMPTSGA
jgi:heme/copper-type cytochrome/quinol oxidase subunit 2